jgi:hypothetical protein
VLDFFLTAVAAFFSTTSALTEVSAAVLGFALEVLFVTALGAALEADFVAFGFASVFGAAFFAGAAFAFGDSLDSFSAMI